MSGDVGGPSRLPVEQDQCVCLVDLLIAVRQEFVSALVDPAPVRSEGVGVQVEDHPVCVEWEMC